MDLRDEFKDLLSNNEAIGRWVVVRHFSNEHSEFWKPETSEAVGGPAYKYTDTVIEAYSVPVMRTLKTQGVHIETTGPIEEIYDRFFFKYDVIVEENDEIFDLEFYESIIPTMVLNESEVDISRGKILPVTRYKVKIVYNYRGEQGRIEYKAADSFKTVLR